MLYLEKCQQNFHGDPDLRGGWGTGSLSCEALLRRLNTDPTECCINELGSSPQLPVLSFPSYYMNQITGTSAGFPVK